MKCPRCGLVTFDDLPQCPRCKESFALVRPLATGTLGGARHLLRDEPELRGKLRDRLHRARLDRRKQNENPLAVGSDPDAPDWFDPATGDDDGAEAAIAPDLATAETSEEGQIVYSDDRSPDEETRGAAATADVTDDEFEAGELTTDPVDGAEPEFTGEVPGFSDWREELRERLKKIRARREQERLASEAEAETAESAADGEVEELEVEELAAEDDDEAAAEEIAAEEGEELAAEEIEAIEGEEPAVVGVDEAAIEGDVADFIDEGEEAEVPAMATAGDFLDKVVPDRSREDEIPAVDVDLGPVEAAGEVDFTIDGDAVGSLAEVVDIGEVRRGNEARASEPVEEQEPDDVVVADVGELIDSEEVEEAADEGAEDDTPLEDLTLEQRPDDLVVDLDMVDEAADLEVNNLDLQDESDTEDEAEPQVATTPARSRGWRGHEDLPSGDEDEDPLAALEAIGEEAVDAPDAVTPPEPADVTEPVDAPEAVAPPEPAAVAEPVDAPEAVAPPEVVELEDEAEEIEAVAPPEVVELDDEAEEVVELAASETEEAVDEAEAGEEPTAEADDEGLFDWGDAAVIVADVATSEPSALPESWEDFATEGLQEESDIVIDGEEAEPLVEAADSLEDAGDTLEDTAAALEEGEDLELEADEPEELEVDQVVADDDHAATEQPLDLPAPVMPDLPPPSADSVPELDFEPSTFAAAGSDLATPELDIAEVEAEEIPALEWDSEISEAEGKRQSSAGPIGERAAAVLCDTLVLLAIGAALVGVASSGTGLPFRQILASEALWLGLAWSIFAAGYSIFFVGSCGQTIGRMIMRLRVVGTDQFTVGFDRAAIRMVAWIVALLPAGLGLLPAIRDPQNRGLHDRISHTRVVKA